MTFFYHHKSKHGYDSQKSVASEAVNDSLTVDEASAIQINVSTLLSNDTTGYTTTNSSQGSWYWSKWSCWNKGKTTKEYDDVELVSVQSATNGTVVLENGVVTFSPEPGYTGPAVFTYTISDGKGGTDTATVDLNIVDVNQGPIAVNDQVVGNNNAPIVIDPATLLANDSYPDGDAISIVSVQNAQNGTVEFVNGAIVFTPDEGYTGPAQFDYSISDNVPSDTLTYYTDAHGNIGTLDIETGARDVITDTPKVFYDIAMGSDGELYAMEHGHHLYSVNKETGDTTYIGKTSCDNVNGLVGGGDGKLYGVSDSKIYEISQETAKASVLDIPKLGSAGDVVYTDGKLYITTDADQLVSYDLTTQQTEVVINNLPDCKSYGISLTAEGLIAGVTSSDEIYYVDVAKGELILTGIESSGPTIYGLASAQTTAADTATVDINVTPGNQAPIAQDDVIGSDTVGVVTIAPATLLANDSDPDGDPLSGFSVQDAVNGNVEFDGTNINFTPTDGYEGPASFTYTITDGNGAFDTATVDLSVNGISVPATPTDAPDMTPETDTGISDSDDITGDTTPSFAVSIPDGMLPQLYIDGVKVLAEFNSADGTLTPFEPLGEGDHVVTYSLINGGVESAPSPALPFQIDTTPVNLAPDAVDDVIVADEAGPVTIPVATLLSNDVDPDGDTLSGVSFQDVQNGTVVLEGENLIFTPNEDYVGPASFTYTISDGNGGVDTATVRLEVDGSIAPDTPTTAPDMTPESDTGIDNADDITSDTTPSFEIGSVGENTPQLYVNGEAVPSVYDSVSGLLTPSIALPEGELVITYTLLDPAGNESASSPALTVVIDTTAPGTPSDAPDMTPETDTGISDSDDVTADTTPSFEIGNIGDNTAQLYVNGEPVASVFEPVDYTLTPVNPLPEGNHVITYTLTDLAGNESQPSPALSVEINTTPENQNPDAVDDTFDDGAVGTITLTVEELLANDSDADGDTLQVTGVQDAEFGEAVLENGVVTFTPMEGYQGPAGFTYTVDDGQGGTDTATVNLLVDGREVILAPETAPDMTAETDTGASDSDDLTNDTTPEFAIADPGEYTPVLYINGEEVPSTYDPAKGVLLPNTPLENGETSIAYTLQNDQGQESPMSEALVIVVNNQNYEPVSPADMTAESDTGVSEVDDVTSNTQPAFEIDAPNGLTPVMFVNGEQVEASFEVNTNLLTPVQPLPDGAHTISYKLVDPAGNETPLSQPLNVVIDTTPPEVGDIAITAESDTGESQSDGVTDDTTPSFSIDPTHGAQPTLFINGAPVEATFDAENYTLTPTEPLPEGNYAVNYTLTDPAGNISLPSDSVSIEITTFGAENAAPDAQDDWVDNGDAGAVTIDVATLLSNDSDADGDALTVLSVQEAVNGTVVLDGSTITFTPTHGYTGPASFAYTVADGQGGTDSAVVDLTVDGVPTPAAPSDTPDLIAASDAGVSDTDDVTADTTPSFSIADVGENTPNLYIDGVKVEATYEGGVLTPVNALPEGAINVTYTITNRAGKESAQSNGLNVEITADDGGNTNNGDNLIINGSFEDTTGMSEQEYGYQGGGVIPGWTDKDGYRIDVHNDNRGDVHATDGNNWLDLGGVHANNHVVQTINGVEADQSYQLTFDVADIQTAEDGQAGDNTLTVIWGGEVIAEIDPTDGGVMTQYSYTVEGGAGDGNNRLEFKGDGLVDNFGVSLDNIILVSTDGTTTVDEPPVVDDPPVLDEPVDSEPPVINDGVLHFNDFTPGVDNPPPAGWYTDNPGGVIEVFPHNLYGVEGEPTNVLELERHGEDASNFFTYVASEAGEPITLEFDYSPRVNATTDGNSAIHILVDGEVFMTVDRISTSGGLTHHSAQITGTGEPMRIEFQAADTNGVGGLLDNIYLSEDPLYLDGLPELPQEPPVVEPPVVETVENTAPDAQDDALDGTRDDAIVINPATLLGNDVDADGDALQGVSVQDAVNGTVVFEDGNVIFTPNEGYIGDASFTYTVTDGQGGYDTATVNLTVAPALPDEPPVTVDEPTVDVPPVYLLDFDDYAPNTDSELPAGWYTDNPGNRIEVQPSDVYGVPGEPSNVLGLERQAEDPSNFYTFIETDAGETITLSFDYSATADRTEGDDSAIQVVVNDVVIDTVNTQTVGFESFTYQIDGTGEPMKILFQSVNQNADGGLLDNITLSKIPMDIVPTLDETPIEPVGEPEIPVVENTAPNAIDDVVEVDQSGVIVIDPATLLANDTDADGDVLSGLTVSDAVNGTVSFDGENILFFPFEGYEGAASFKYTVTDDKGAVDSASVNLTVVAQAPLESQATALEQESVSLDMESIVSGVDAQLPSGWFTDNAGGKVEVNSSAVYGIPGDAHKVLELESYEGEPSNLFTMVNAEAGETINLSFDYSARADYEGEGSAVHVVVNGEIIDTVSANTAGFTNYQFSFDATGEPMRVELQAANNDSVGGLVDDIQVNYMVLPEADTQQSIRLDMDSIAQGVDAGLPAGWATDNAGGRVEVNSSTVYGIPGAARNVMELERYEGDASNLYTTVTAQAGEAVSLSFDYSARAGYEGEGSAINILVNGEVIDTVVANTAGFNNYQFSFDGTGEPMRVELQATNSDSVGGLVDDIQINYTVPSATPVAEVDAPIIATEGEDNIQGTDRDETVFGLSGDDVIDGGAGDDVIAGGEGADTLTGGIGADTFTWSLSDVSGDGPSVDIVTDFNDGQDAIDLKDMLVGESHDAETLSNYLHFETDGDKTTVHVSSEGKFAHTDSGDVDTSSVPDNTTQTIELDGVDLTAGGSMSDLQVIQNLISTNQIITD